MKRVFVAIDISEEARRQVTERIAAFKLEQEAPVVRWIRPENLHLTVRFLGDVDDDQVSAVAAAGERSAGTISAFKLCLECSGVFPSPEKARVLWIGVKDEQKTAGRLRNMLETEFGRLGISRDDKPFKPHLTIGRVKDPNLAKPIIRKHLEAYFEPIEFEVGEVVLYESKLMPTGSVYSKLAGFALR